MKKSNQKRLLMDRRFCLFVFLFSLGLFSVCEVDAQIVSEKVSYQHSSMELYGRISDTTNLGAVPLAHILIWHGKDTTKLVSNLVGHFTYKGRLADTMQVQVTALGFKPFIGQYIPKKHGLDICIQLQQEDIVLDEVIVTGKRLMMVVKGDTLKYNVDEVKTLQGAKMGKILEKLPGVSMDGGLKVNGVPIHRIYVNGEALFKELDALNYIAADNVKDVKVFDERNKEDLAQGLRHGRREKVMDVTTKEKVSREEIAKTKKNDEKKSHTFEIGGGLDASRNRTSKYPEKLLFKYVYSEGKPDAYMTNAKRFSVDYSNLFLEDKREFGGAFEYTKRFAKLSYRSQYAYRNSTTYSNRWDEQSYFPTERYDSRYYGQTSSEKNMAYKYATIQEIAFRIKTVSANFSGTYSYNVGKNWKNSRMLSTLDEEVLNSANVQDYNRQYQPEGKIKFKISTDKKKKNTFVLSSLLRFNQTDQSGWQLDTLEASSRQVHLIRDMDRDAISLRTGAEFSSVISPLFKLFLKTEYTYDESTFNRIGKNRLSGLLDSNYTQNNSTYYNTFTVHPMLTYYGNRVEISAGGSVYHSSRNWVERFPDWEQEKDRFLYFNPVLELKATFSPTSNLDASYYTESQKPSVGHLRSVIDDANPLNLRSGNPNLKVTHEHQLNVNYYKILPLLSASLQSGISLMIKRNPIVSNSRYFTETTYLPEYNYTVERGATLHTYENSNPEYFLRVVVGFEKFWSFLGKCTFAPSYERRVTPSFTQGEENDLTMNRGVFDVNILTNFSKKVSLTIFSKSAFDHSTSQLGQSSKSLEETLTLRSSTKIIPKCSVDVNMVYNYRKNLTFQNEENNILLNVFISRSLGKYFSMSLNGYNLLDSKNKNTIGTTAEYDFRRGHNQTGRYITMNLRCKF